MLCLFSPRTVHPSRQLAAEEVEEGAPKALNDLGARVEKAGGEARTGRRRWHYRCTSGYQKGCGTLPPVR